jgi:hypothetical protein
LKIETTAYFPENDEVELAALADAEVETVEVVPSVQALKKRRSL